MGGDAVFKPGDTVVYRHRVCEVASIREGYFEGRDYYELHALFENRLKLFVAVDEADDAGMRPVMSGDEALALIDSILDAKPIDMSALEAESSTPTLRDRHVREEYDRLVKSGDPEELIPILRSVREHAAARKRDGRKVTSVDKRYFEMAEGMLFDELAVSLGIDRDKFADFFEERLENLKRVRAAKESSE